MLVTHEIVDGGGEEVRSTGDDPSPILLKSITGGGIEVDEDELGG